MATIKSFTDLEQSKKLAEFLPLESADMVYFGIHQCMDGTYYISGTNAEDDIVPIYKTFCIKVFAKTTASDVINQLPCWSLAALYNILPTIDDEFEPQLHRSLDKYRCTYEGEEDSSGLWRVASNPVDACVAMIIELHKLKML